MIRAVLILVDTSCQAYGGSIFYELPCISGGQDQRHSRNQAGIMGPTTFLDLGISSPWPVDCIFSRTTPAKGTPLLPTTCAGLHAARRKTSTTSQYKPG